MGIKNHKVERRSKRRKRFAHALDFLERQIWPNIAPKLLGRRVTKKERERILGC